MKKYKVTKNHPDLKKGVEIKKDNDNYYIGDNSDNFLISDYIIELWEKEKWIKRIQEPEFTKDDMIDFVKYYDYKSPDFELDIFNKWLKYRK